MRYAIWIFLAVEVWIVVNRGYAQQINPANPGTGTQSLTLPADRIPSIRQPSARQPSIQQPSVQQPFIQQPSMAAPSPSAAPLPPTAPSPSVAPSQANQASPLFTPPATPGYGSGTGAGLRRAPTPLVPAMMPGAVTYTNPFAQAQGYITSPQAAMAGGGPKASALPSKPHANYTPPPAISPYMNLFRNDNAHGTINNYYTLVKPALEQRAINQRAQSQIQSLQTTTRTQSRELNQLNPQANPASGAMPGQFMNFQDYYPGYRSVGR